MVQSERDRYRSLRAIVAAVLVTISLPLLVECCTDTGHGGAKAPDTLTAITLRDAVGQQVTLPRPAVRVVSLAPNLTEMLAAVGGEKLLVGRTRYCDYPPSVLAVPVVGDMLTLNHEMVLGRRPDLILMSIAGNYLANYQKLQQLGLRPFAIDASTLDGVVNSIDTVAILIGHRDQGAVVSNHLREVVDSIGALGAAGPRVSTFIVIDKSPLMTVSRGFLTDLVTKAGGVNIAEGASASYPLFSREELLRKDPEVILFPTSAAENLAGLLKAYPEWRNLRAVRHGHVYALPTNIVERPGPRIGFGLTAIYEALHGADPATLFAKYARY